MFDEAPAQRGPFQRGAHLSHGEELVLVSAHGGSGSGCCATRARRANAISLLDADLHGLLQIKEVNETLQPKLSIARVRTID